MDLDLAGGPALKNFIRSLSCLARIGDDLDFSPTPHRLSISTVNPSRTAFAVLHLPAPFFSHYRLLDPDRPQKLSITARALLSTLRTKSPVDSVRIAVRGPGVGQPGQSRLVVHLYCQHGVRKKHSLTYSDPHVQNWARFDLNACTSSWTVSARVLKDWTEHFHLRPGASGAADEITFYCGRDDCRLKSFNDSGFDVAKPADAYASRPLATELHVDVDDFDAYDVPEPQVVTFALRDFKSIITLADSLPTALTAHFSTGGRPLLLQLGGDSFEAKFVIATTDYDSGAGSSNGTGGRTKSEGTGYGAAGAVEDPSRRHQSAQSDRDCSVRAAGRPAVVVKREPSEVGGGPPSPAPAARTSRSRIQQQHHLRHQPLFNPPTPSPAPPHPASRPAADDEEEEEYGGGMDPDALGFEDLDAAFAQIDQLSQTHLTALSQRAGGGGGRMEVGVARRGGYHEEGEQEEESSGPMQFTTQFGPTQPVGRTRDHRGLRGARRTEDVEPRVLSSDEDEEGRASAAKRARWNLMGDL